MRWIDAIECSRCMQWNRFFSTLSDLYVYSQVRNMSYASDNCAIVASRATRQCEQIIKTYEVLFFYVSRIVAPLDASLSVWKDLYNILNILWESRTKRREREKGREREKALSNFDLNELYIMLLEIQSSHYSASKYTFKNVTTISSTNKEAITHKNKYIVFRVPLSWVMWNG